MVSRSLESDLVQALRRLSAKGSSLLAVGPGRYRIGGKAVSGNDVNALVADALIGRGLVVAETDDVFAISHAGRAFLRRLLVEPGDYQAQHQDRRAAIVTHDEGPHRVVVNQAESPLSWLRQRHDRDGRPLIGAVEFTAGERLRADYSRGQIMPRVTANWTAAVAGRGRDGGGRASAELTEVAIGARRRVEQALGAVGPELGGLLVDFCCFLKGLEEIGRERRWPARSAKVALRLGLSSLARHYGLTRQARGRDRSQGLLHWGAEEYRPTVD